MIEKKTIGPGHIEGIGLLMVGSGFHELGHFIQRNQGPFNDIRIQENFIIRGIKYL